MSIDQTMPEFYLPETQSKVLSELKNIIKAERIPNAFIFTGGKNTGKEYAALLFAKACNCLKNNKWPCDSCKSCKKIDAMMHPDIVRISLEKKKTQFPYLRYVK